MCMFLDNESEEWSCVRLDTLNLRSNCLEELPSGICGARHLKQLLLAQNQLKTLPNPWNCPLVRILSDVDETILKGFQITATVNS